MSLEMMLTEIDKILVVRAGLPRGLFIDVAPKVLAGWRARAEKKVTGQLVNAFKQVLGNENILFKFAETSLGTPEGTVRQVVFAAMSGGEATLRELVHEFETSGRFTGGRYKRR
ncbi:hypothetical protein ACFCXT_23270 [Streptomyces vinaceus]|uniref:hypothetical protein n=1 Tax=Streptomyces vinaceus TaxID=1960 RepID=UPI0035E11646